MTSIPVNVSKAHTGGKDGDIRSEDKPSLPLIADCVAVYHRMLLNSHKAFLHSRHQFHVSLVRSHNMFLDKMLSVLRIFNDLSLLALNGNNILVNQRDRFDFKRDGG